MINLFLWCILAYLYPVEDHENRTSNYSMHFNKHNLGGLEFPMKVKDIPKFERLNRLYTGGQQYGINVFELIRTVLSSLHINTIYDRPQIDLMLYENQYC